MNSIGDRYKDGGISTHLYRWLRLEHGGLRDLAAHFPDEGLIIDLGCGAGLLSHVLVEGHPKRTVLAIDHDEARVASVRASAKGMPIEVGLADIATVALPRCAGIALIDVLHYFDAETQEHVLDRCVEALEPGGVLVLRDPDPDGRLRFDLTRTHERVATGLGLTKAKLGHYRRGHDWSFLLRMRGLQTHVGTLSWRSPYADRTVVGSKR